MTTTSDETTKRPGPARDSGFAPGFPHREPLAGEILRALVGSTMHGIGLEGGEDRDEMGVMLEAPRFITGLEKFEQFEFRTAEERARAEGRPTKPQPRSEPGDLDLLVYSARKYLRLAASGNPTVLLLLFVPEDLLVVQTNLGRELQALAPQIASKLAAKRFLGYLHAQRDRLEGIRGGRHTNRPELEAIHTFDTKYAAHMIRLGFQGREYVRTGRITLPMDDWEGEVCRQIRRGEETKAAALDLARTLERDIEDAVDDSPLPDAPNVTALNAWLHRAYTAVWDS